MEAVVKLSTKAGLHGRPGALLVDLSLKNPGAKIFLEKSGKKIKADSILNLLALGVKKGEEVRVIVQGESESRLVEEVRNILQGVTP